MEKEKHSLSEVMLHYLMALEQQKEQDISKPRFGCSVIFEILFYAENFSE